MKELTREIVQYIDTYKEDGKWTGEVNMVSWNGGEPKVEIRNWNEDHSKCSKGITLTTEEARILGEILTRI